MRPHSPSHVRRARRAAPPPDGFLSAWEQLLDGRDVPSGPSRRGRNPRAPLTQELSALNFHVMTGPGMLGEHFAALFDAPLADRRAWLPWEIFTGSMRRMLRPRATPRGASAAFWHGWPTLDGTQWNLTNMPPITAQVLKARTRRGRAAFAKLSTAVLLDLGFTTRWPRRLGARARSSGRWP